MKKLICIFLFFNLFILIAEAQVQQKWVARYNGPGNGFDQPKSVVTDGSGNVYVAGTSTGNGSGVDYVTIKYNSNGVQQWVQRYNGTGNSYDYLYAMITDGLGNIYVSGGSWGTTSSFDAVTIKYNSAGVQQWIHRFNGGNNGNDIAVSLFLDAVGNLYVAGQTNYVYIDFMTLKYNSSGVLQWSQTWNNDDTFGDDHGSAVTVDAEGSVYTTGYSQGMGGGFNFITVKHNSSGVQQWFREYSGSTGLDDWPTVILSDGSGNVILTGFASDSPTAYDYVTIKYNSSGDQQWLQKYNGPLNGGEYANSMKFDPSGNIIVTGSSYGAGAVPDYATVKYSPSGVQQWASRYSGTSTGFDAAWSVTTDASGNIYVTGESNGNGSQRDYATIKYNSSGVQQWVQRYNGPGNSSDIARSIAVDGAGNIYVTGESTGSGSNADFATIKYSKKGAGHTDPLSYDLMENYPNPFNPVTVISYQIPVDGYTSIKIYDILGNEVATLVNERQNAGVYSFEWNATNFASGIYFYKLVTDGFVKTKKMNLIK